MGLFEFDFEGINTWLGELGEVINTGAGIYRDIKDSDDDPMPVPPPPSPYVPGQYYPNAQLSDFAFTPNWYLIGFGVVLLIIAFIVSRK